MFDYLNKQQVQDVMLLFCVHDTIDKIVKTWTEHGNLTKEEQRAIKTSNTWNHKFLDSLQSRLSDKEKKKLVKRYSDYYLQIMDQWLLKKFTDEMNEKAQVVRMERELFESFAYETCTVKCIDCNKSLNDCNWHDVLYENMMEYANQKPNCPYAVISEEVKKRLEEKKRAKEEKKGKVSKRKAKKQANRYDDDTEEYVYNFTPKRGK